MNIGNLEALQGFDPENFYDAYASWTDTVAKYPITAESHYLALGITDELGELAAARGANDVLKEAGDVLWYIARYSTRVLHIPFSAMIDSMRLGPAYCDSLKATVACGVIAGVEKKRIRDGSLWSVETTAQKTRSARDAACDLLIYVHGELAIVGRTLSDAIDANQGKLAARLAAGTLQGDGDNR